MCNFNTYSDGIFYIFFQIVIIPTPFSIMRGRSTILPTNIADFTPIPSQMLGIFISISISMKKLLKDLERNFQWMGVVGDLLIELHEIYKEIWCDGISTLIFVVGGACKLSLLRRNKVNTVAADALALSVARASGETVLTIYIYVIIRSFPSSRKSLNYLRHFSDEKL